MSNTVKLINRFNVISYKIQFLFICYVFVELNKRKIESIPRYS